MAIGRLACPNPARDRRTASLTACTASACPISRARRVSSSLSSFCRSSWVSSATGTPVRRDTTSAIDARVTSRVCEPVLRCQASVCSSNCAFLALIRSSKSLASSKRLREVA
ncbi:hypothetical protein D3C72_1412370 [compost metagenome]